MAVHVYFGVENLGLNDSQRDTLVAALRKLGPESHPSPACLCHWRTRLDGDAAIFEALFNEESLTIAKFKQRLAALFDVAVGEIGHDHQPINFSGDGPASDIVTFDHNAVDRLRVALFGGVEAEWMESGDETRAYLKLYQEDWEQELP